MSLRVLTYHSIIPDSVMAPSLARAQIHVSAFDRQLRFMKRFFQILPLNDLIQKYQRGEPVSHRCLAITFDDGYETNASLAAPLLRKYNIPATFFISSGHCDSPRLLWFSALRLAEFFNVSVPRALRAEPARHFTELVTEMENRVNEFPDLKRLYSGMSRKQIEEIARDPLFEIGGHTVTHPHLPKCNPDVAYLEIVENRKYLNQILGRPIRYFAYPNGLFDQKTIELVKDVGYQGAFACEEILKSAQPQWQFPRIGIFHDAMFWAALKVVRGPRVRFFN